MLAFTQVFLSASLDLGPLSPFFILEGVLVLSLLRLLVASVFVLVDLFACPAVVAEAIWALVVILLVGAGIASGLLRVVVGASSFLLSLFPFALLRRFWKQSNLSCRLSLPVRRQQRHLACTLRKDCNPLLHSFRVCA